MTATRADHDAIDETFARAADELGRPAALVNNAAIVAPKTTVAEITASRLRRIMDVNVIGTFLCARAAVHLMSTQSGGSGGSIVNVSSAASAAPESTSTMPRRKGPSTPSPSA